MTNTQDGEREKLIKNLLEYSWAYDGIKFRGDKIANFILADRRRILAEISIPLIDERVLHDNTEHGNAWAVSRYRSVIDKALAIINRYESGKGEP